MHGWFWFKTVLHKVYVTLAHVDLWLQLQLVLSCSPVYTTCSYDLEYEKRLHVVKMSQCEDQIYDLLGENGGKLSECF